MRNAVILVVAVAVLAVGFVLATGGGDEGSETSAGTETTEQTAAPAAATSTSSAASRSTTTEAAPAPKPKPAIPTVTFADGEAKGGVKRLEFDKGEQVRFRVRSDVAEEIHVHGFDEYADVAAGGSVTLSFPAKFDGAYEVEMHGAAKQVATLEIQP